MTLRRRDVLLGAAAVLPGAALIGCSPDTVPGEVVRRGEAGRGGAGRGVVQVVSQVATRDGAGVNLRRALGARPLPMLDPFLLLDEFRSDRPDDYLAGFPDHPHRGFETVTYMLEGAMEHRGSVGNRGRLAPGSAQWMTAGRGIIHSEMPRQERGLMWGYQLWVNLPARSKMIRPRYQDIAPAAIPTLRADRSATRVIAGEALGVRGPVEGIVTAPVFLDISLERGGRVAVPLPPTHNALAEVIDGAVRIEGREVRRGQLAVLSTGGAVTLGCDAASGRALLLAGRPLHEPVARRGPFVMSTDEEIVQAFRDYRSGRLVEGT
jgi:redox-sensitive bicupin YhaK (pirin superfamily)